MQGGTRVELTMYLAWLPNNKQLVYHRCQLKKWSIIVIKQ